MLEARPVLVVILAIFHFCLSSTTPLEWEIAVSMSNRLDLLAINGSFVNSVGCLPGQGLSYDYLRNNLYFINGVNPSYSVSRIQVSRKGYYKAVQQLGKADSNLASVAVDSTRNMLYWTSYSDYLIKFASLNGSKDSSLMESHTFLNLSPRKPSELAIDPCRRMLFWVAWEKFKASIVMCSLDDCQSKEELISGLTMPTGLVYSQDMNALLWSDRDKETQTISMFSLDERVTRIIHSSSFEGPFSIATRRGHIFWLDEKEGMIWKIVFNSSLPRELVKNFSEPSNKPKSILIVPDQIYLPGRCDSPETIHHSDETFWNRSGVCLNGKLINSTCVCSPGYTGEHCGIPYCHNYCLNNGMCTLPSSRFDRPRCSCPKLFRGDRCELKVCPSSYCLNEGFCDVSASGEPQCTCRSGFTGLRCESSYCPSSYCLNGGKCNSSREGMATCSCLPGFFGPRCELSSSFCQLLCSTEEENSTVLEKVCRCSLKISRSFWSEKPETIRFIALILQGCVILVLVVACVLLLRRVVELGKRPRLKRRFTSNSHPKVPDQCEIAIENCCNMNICETPCYEPEFRTPLSTGKKKEEKKELLNNMEEEHSSS